MDDEGVVGRASLHVVDPGDRDRIGGISGQPVDGLGRDGDQTAVRQAAGGLGGIGEHGEVPWFASVHGRGLRSGSRR